MKTTDDIVTENIVIRNGITSDWTGTSIPCYFVEDCKTKVIWATSTEREIAERIMKMLKLDWK